MISDLSVSHQFPMSAFDCSRPPKAEGVDTVDQDMG